MKSAITTVLVTGATVAGVAGVLVLSPSRSALSALNGGTSQLGTDSDRSGGEQLGEGQVGGGPAGPQYGQQPGPGGAAFPGEDGESSDDGSDDTGSGSTGSGSTGSTGSTATGIGYTGSAYQSPYGPMQVAITVDGTRITGIQWTQLPMSDGHSYRINSYAAPLLVEQAMTAQSATVDGVSGATYTTDGFRTSLESAIQKAGL